jgi:hypothetical protein
MMMVRFDGAWLSLVERSVRDEVGLVHPHKRKSRNRKK